MCCRSRVEGGTGADVDQAATGLPMEILFPEDGETRGNDNTADFLVITKASGIMRSHVVPTKPLTGWGTQG